MRVLVTGGAGFIGSRVAGRLIERGDAVDVLDDLSTGRRDAVPDGARLHAADVADPRTVDLVRALRPEVVIHAAAQVSVARSVDAPDRDAAVNVAGTRHVVAGAAGSRRVVFLSSGGAIYGESAAATEGTSAAPKSPYGVNKLRAEDVVRSSGLSFAIARLSNVYGPGQRRDQEGGVVAIFTDALLAHAPVVIHGDGLQRRDLIHVDDVTDALLAMAGSSEDGVWNVATGSSWTILELLARLEARLGPAVEHVHAPPRAGDVRSSSLAIDRIRRELGWRPRFDLDAGLDAMLGAIAPNARR